MSAHAELVVRSRQRLGNFCHQRLRLGLQLGAAKREHREICLVDHLDAQPLFFAHKLNLVLHLFQIWVGGELLSHLFFHFVKVGLVGCLGRLFLFGFGLLVIVPRILGIGRGLVLGRSAFGAGRHHLHHGGLFGGVGETVRVND